MMHEAYSSYLEQCDSRGEVPVDRSQWPGGFYGGRVQFLLGVEMVEFSIIFQFRGLISNKHNIEAESSISFGGHYRPESSGREEFPSLMMMRQDVRVEDYSDEDSGKEPVNRCL